ncbi:DUF2917 domain-containing protein [Variovorax sp. PCZ-1]|uniref:DUF2917 domain-containing protein n=1 Tax=Variovorax sp. PCZ-1 TaxID=2835533 RepID=UPI0020BECD30|nr:DUF2917 domain-containing protein [Variovorax sp. PCZ-1]
MAEIASISVSQYAAACMSTRANPSFARAGAFVLAPAQALALRPKTESSIRITCGSAWVTINDGCDYFLAAGEQLTAPAGSRVVMESMRRDGQVKFDWQPVMPAQRERSQLRGGVDEMAAEVGLSQAAQALRDLRGAADLAARGLVGLATALVAGLARGLGIGFAALARTAHSNANRAQGRMAS